MSVFEIYVLCKERNSSVVRSFLNEFIPNRSEVAEDYPFPELVDNPEVIYNETESLMSRLDLELSEGYSIYWNNEIRNDIIQAMVFYTEDGHMIAGLVVNGDRKDWLSKLSNHVNGSYGYITQEEAPPETKEEFITMCSNSNDFKLINGSLIK